MPFYCKKDESLVVLKGPTDVHDKKGRTLVSLYPQKDPEQVMIDVPPDTRVVAVTERDQIFLPGENGIVNRDDIFIKDLSSGFRTAVLHSEKPVR